MQAAAIQKRKAKEFSKDKKLKRAVNKQVKVLLKADKDLHQAYLLDSMPDNIYKKDKKKVKV